MSEFFIDDFTFPQFVSASADPRSILKFDSKILKNDIDEVCLVELENGKTLFVRYVGTNENTGITETLEFDSIIMANDFLKENFE